MEFHSLPRRDLQFLCKKNKIPANMTNLAMADALKSLEIVEGLNEYLNQSDPNVLQCQTSVAKLPPNTANRTTRRKTAVKAEPQSSSQMVSRSCRLTSKSLDGEMNLENVKTNVAQELETNNVKIEASVAKTPAARSTRKAAAAASCSSKVQESKKGELVQSAYSTRRSTRLLEKGMADLSLKTKETLDKPEKIEETEQKVSAQEKNPAGSEERSEESEVIPGRDLSASMEKEWDMMKNDSGPVIGGLEISVDLGDTNKETVNEVMADEKESQNSLDQVEKQEETLQADVSICEEGLKNDVNDQEIGDTEIYVDLGDILVLEHDNTETNNDKQESKNVQASDTLAHVDHQESEQAIIHENDSVPEKINTFDEETMVNQIDGDSETEPEDNSGLDSDGTISEGDSNPADHQETEHAIQENDPETEKINTVDEVKIVDQTDDGSESEPEEDNSGVDSDGTISEADSNQAAHLETEPEIQENETEKINTLDEVKIVDQTDGDSETEQEEDNSGVDSDGTISEADSNQADHQEIEQAIQENASETEKINTFDEVKIVNQTDCDLETVPEEEDNSGVDSDGTVDEADSNQADQEIQENDSETANINIFDEIKSVDQTEAEPEEDNSGVDSDGTISEADSNQAVQGSDIADEEMILSEPEVSATVPTSPPFLLEEAKVETAPLSSIAPDSISAQFPRPNKSASKNSAMKKLVNVGNTNKENNMEMMMMNVVNNSDDGEAKKKSKKKVEIDEENLKDASIRQLVKMVKELSIKSSNNRTALQILPGNNQIAE